MKVEIDKILIEGRIRKDMGDIEGLAASINAHGLLHPVVVSQDGTGMPRLLAGERRLAACKLLGWEYIEATVMQLEAEQLLLVERDENVQRKPFSPSEMYELAQIIEKREQKIAKKRMTRGMSDEKGVVPWRNVRQGTQRGGRTKEIAALAVGTSATNLRKIEMVMEASKGDPDKFSNIVSDMDETGNVAGALRAVKQVQRHHAIKEQAKQVRDHTNRSYEHKVYRANHFGFLLPESVDLVVADPPYNISRERVITFSTEDRGSMSNDFGEWDYMEEREYLEKTEKWCRQFYLVLREGGSVYVFAAEAYISFWRKALIDAGFSYKNTLIWTRPNPKPKPDKTSYVAACDFICFAVKGRGHTFNYTKHSEMYSFVKMGSASGDERSRWAHPTQKPIKLIKKLIQTSSKPGDLVLDPFAGSGTTGEACQKTGRRFILVEKEPHYVDVIMARTGVQYDEIKQT